MPRFKTFGYSNIFCLHFISDDIITAEQRNEARALGNQSHKERARAVWQILHTTTNTKAFDVICKALVAAGFDHLRIKLIDEREKVFATFRQQVDLVSMSSGVYICFISIIVKLWLMSDDEDYKFIYATSNFKKSAKIDSILF